MPTTRALLDRLETDSALRRICGWERKNDVPDEWTFSRAFAEFSKSRLPERVHEAFIKKAMPISHSLSCFQIVKVPWPSDEQDAIYPVNGRCL